MIKALTTDWHAARLFRTLTGVAALIYGIVKLDSMMGIAGSMLLLMGLSNMGCGAGGCGIPSRPPNTAANKTDAVQYEELN